MSIHLFTANDDLQVLMAYENGSVHLRRYATPEKSKSVEGKGWELLWSVKLHNEASGSFLQRSNPLAYIEQLWRCEFRGITNWL